jgi:SAM-dependent methyltransferase
MAKTRTARILSGGSSHRAGPRRRSWAQVYAETPYQKLPWYSPRPSSWLVKAVRARWVSPPGPIVDIGCGAGTNVLWLAGRRFRATGIDLAPGAIAAAERRARRRKSSASFQTGNALSLPLRTSSFGAALDNGCFHTLPLTERGHYAAEVARVLRPRGVFLISWIAREETRKFGPAHRPSLAELTDAFESRFIFEHTEFFSGTSSGAWVACGHPLARYSAVLTRRTAPQPPIR